MKKSRCPADWLDAFLLLEQYLESRDTGERMLVFLDDLLAVNVLAFILYGVDKKRARNREWRISEKTLIGIAVIGGSIGAILGMYVFHHKTRH